MMTAQWWPWFDFELGRRVPARAFTPRPNVDGGVLIITRRQDPLIPPRSRQAFQTMVHKIFTGGGKGIAQIATRAQLFRTTREARRWAIGAGLDPHALPKDLSAHQWVELFQAGKTPRNEVPRFLFLGLCLNFHYFSTGVVFPKLGFDFSRRAVAQALVEP